MTNLEKQANNTSWARGFEALNTKSTWSSFDDITWDDFNGDDHSVPEPNEPSQPLWLRRREMKATIKEEAPEGREDEQSPMEVDNWDAAELGAVPENLIPENDLIVPENLIPENELIVNELKQDGELCLDEQVFNEQYDSSAARFTYVPAEEEIGLFGNENEVDKGGTLLGYSWDNLDDMDNLFQNEESAFCQDATDALIQWPPSSSSSPDSAAAVTITVAKVSPELRAMKGKSHQNDVKMEFIPLRSTSEACLNNSETCANNSENDGAMDDHTEADPEYSKSSSDAAAAEDTLKPLTSPRSKDQKPVEALDKVLERKEENPQAQKHRQGSSHRRDRLKKQLYQKKQGQTIIIQPKQQALTHYSSAQLKPAVASSLQVYPQVMAAGVAPGMLGVAPPPQGGQYLGPVHHSPYLIQGSQAPLVCFEHPETRQKIETLAPPPVSGSNMTPQEKIEKLKWKQKMHRLASEQQQQQFAKQCVSLDPGSKAKQGKSPGKRPLLETEAGPVSIAEESDARFVEATVLSQLLTIMSKLDVGTRICIRDALYRLAKSAVNRHSTDGASSSECSITSAAGDKSLSSAFRYPMLETETNPIDRTIANLLFHKRSTGTLLALPPQPEWNPSWQQGDEAALENAFNLVRGGGEQSTDLSSDDRESEGSSRKIEKLKASSSADATTPRSGLKRVASGEFLSSQEDRGKGTSITTSRGDSPRDGKAAKTGIQ